MANRNFSEGPSLLIADPTPFGSQLAYDLERKGFNTIYTTSYDGTRHSIIHDRPNYIVTDILIDDTPIFDLLSIASTQPSTHKTVVVSSSIREETAILSIRHGASNAIAKPTNAAQILRYLGLIENSATLDGVDLSIDDIKREYIRQTLAEHKSISSASNVLGLDRRSLRRTLTRLMSKGEFRNLTQ